MLEWTCQRCFLLLDGFLRRNSLNFVSWAMEGGDSGLAVNLSSFLILDFGNFLRTCIRQWDRTARGKLFGEAGHRSVKRNAENGGLSICRDDLSSSSSCFCSHLKVQRFCRPYRANSPGIWFLLLNDLEKFPDKRRLGKAADLIAWREGVIYTLPRG